MGIVSFDRSTLVLPDGSRFLEHAIETHGDVVVGDHAEVEYGIDTPASVFLGDGVTVLGDLTAGGDVRMDVFSHITGAVNAKGSAWLGEGVHVEGRLSVDEDLDVGDEVTLEEGFEARGWINIRSPVPTVVYMVIYVMQMMRQGRSEEVQRILEQLEDAEETFQVSETFCYIPGGSRLGLQQSRVKGGLRTGADCRVLGNFEVEDDALVGASSEVHGSLRVQGDVRLKAMTEIHGDVEAWGRVSVGKEAIVHGSIEARQVDLWESSSVRGTIKAPGGVNFKTAASEKMEQKVEDFETGVQPIQDLLE